MKKLLLSICVLISFNSNAVFLRHCGHTDNYGSMFESCVNDNFWSVERGIDDLYFLSNCYNYSDSGISSSYEFCVNQNFSNISSALGYRVFLSNCYNSNQDNVSYLYVSCVNNNFQSIQRAID